MDRVTTHHSHNNMVNESQMPLMYKVFENSVFLMLAINVFIFMFLSLYVHHVYDGAFGSQKKASDTSEFRDVCEPLNMSAGFELMSSGNRTYILKLQSSCLY